MFVVPSLCSCDTVVYLVYARTAGNDDAKWVRFDYPRVQYCGFVAVSSCVDVISSNSWCKCSQVIVVSANFPKIASSFCDWAH